MQKNETELKKMTLKFFNGAYFLCLGGSLMVSAALFFALWKAPQRVKKWTLFAVMLLNVAQHLLKSLVYPHLHGTGFGLSNTAYNFCALIILVTPIAFLLKGGALRDFVCLAGTVGSLAALAVPYWFNGKNIFQWEALRFYVCHALMLATSILPLLLGVHRISYKNFWKIPFLFIASLCAILLNDVICISAGLKSGADDLYAALCALNPLWIMGPASPSGLGGVTRLLEAISPDFLGGNGKPYVPVLWHTLPLFIPLLAVSFAVCTLCDLKRFRADIKAARGKKRE